MTQLSKGVEPLPESERPAFYPSGTGASADATVAERHCEAWKFKADGYRQAGKTDLAKIMREAADAMDRLARALRAEV